MKLICALAAATLTLAACDDASQQSAGFSGIGSEPTVSQTSLTDPRLVASGSLNSDIPARSARSSSSNRADHAELAVKKASGSGWRSKPVTVGSQQLALSVLYVNQIPYAVLKPRAGLFTPDIVPETSAAFAANARAMTGCPAASRVYAVGRQLNNPQGLTLALACG